MKQEILMVKARYFIQTAANSKVNLSPDLFRVWQPSDGQTAVLIKVITKTDSVTDMAS